MADGIVVAPAAGSGSTAGAAAAATQNLIAALPGVAQDVIAAKAAEKAAQIQADIAKQQAKTAQAQAAQAQAETQGVLARAMQTAKAQSPWLIPLVVAGAAVGAWFLLRRRKSAQGA